MNVTDGKIAISEHAEVVSEAEVLLLGETARFLLRTEASLVLVDKSLIEAPLSKNRDPPPTPWTRIKTDVSDVTSMAILCENALRVIVTIWMI